MRGAENIRPEVSLTTMTDSLHSHNSNHRVKAA